jgi:hypothetical protein
VIEDPEADGGERTVYSGDVFHVRLDEAV